MERALIEAYVKALLEADEELKVEFSGVGAVQGFTLPLGMSAEIPSEPKVLPFRTKKRRKKK